MPKSNRVKRKKKSDAPALLMRLREHFDTDPSRLPVVKQELAAYDRPNLHLTLEAMAEQSRSGSALVGIITLDEYRGPSLARLTRKGFARHFDEGPVEYIDVALPENRRLACVKQGLLLLSHEGRPVAALLSQDRYSRPGEHLTLEVMAALREGAETFVRAVTDETRAGRAYRGHVLSLESDCYGSAQVKFHTLPTITREQIILPQRVLERIERHAISFSRHADKLRSAQRHLKRGLLLHGPPGTGKTLTAMYLVSQMPGRTVLVLTGQGMGSIESASRIARMLVPSTVILEDVDLIGTERQHQTIGANALLFELLNQMDGSSDDADVLFLLTTNRPDVLEPALASRPGRIDQAIEIPLPDAACRQRLLSLYARGLKLEVSDLGKLIERTEGVSAAFIRELLRKAAVHAAEEDGDPSLTVRDRHIDEALTELLVEGGSLTHRLLGAAPPVREPE